VGELQEQLGADVIFSAASLARLTSALERNRVA